MEEREGRIQNKSRDILEIGSGKKASALRWSRAVRFPSRPPRREIPRALNALGMCSGLLLRHAAKECPASRENVNKHAAICRRRCRGIREYARIPAVRDAPSEKLRSEGDWDSRRRSYGRVRRPEGRRARRESGSVAVDPRGGAAGKGGGRGGFRW